MSSDRFGSYGDRLRQKLMNRSTCENKNLKIVNRSVSRTVHTPPMCEAPSFTTVSSDQLLSESQCNLIDNEATQITSKDVRCISYVDPKEVCTKGSINSSHDQGSFSVKIQNDTKTPSNAQSKVTAEHLQQHRQHSNLRALFEAVENFKENGADRNAFQEAFDNIMPGIFGNFAVDPEVSIAIYPYSDDAFELNKKKSQEKNLETCGLLWCDERVNSGEDSRQMQIKLREAINFLATFQSSGDCQAYIREHTDEQFVLLISGTLGRELIPQVHMLPCITSIYIFCYKKIEHEKWAEQYGKINAVLDNPSDVIKQIRQNQVKLNKAEMDALPATVLKQSEKTHLKLSDENSKFMWFQLVIEVLMRMKMDNLRKNVEDLVHVCKRHYAGNASEEKTLKQLEDNYVTTDAVWWYTGETFVYRILNRALKRQDFEILLLFHFLIRDLHVQLAEEQKKIEKMGIITVYRGQLMDVEELESFRTNETKFIAFNKLLSTSINRRQAISWAKTYSKDSRKTSVLFEIKADTRLKGAKPFANVSHLSQFEVEQEVLFMVGSIFELLNVSRNENENLWIIEMALSGDQDNELKELFKNIKENIPEETNIGVLGHIFVEMGQYDKATRYYKRLLNLLPESHPELSQCYSSLGQVALKNDAYQIAYSYLMKGMDLELQKASPNKWLLASFYNDLGSCVDDPDKRLEYHNRVLDMMGTIVYNAHDMAALYANIGQDYLQKKDYDSALHYCNKAMELLTAALPEKHPKRAALLVFLAELHENKNDYDLALDNYKMALEIQLCCIPDQIDIAKTYKHIATLHASRGELNEALNNYDQALQVYDKYSKNTHHSQIEDILWKRGLVCCDIGDFNSAMRSYQKLLYFQLSYLQWDDLAFADTYKRMGAIFACSSNKTAALEYFHKALSILESNSFSSDNSEVIGIKKAITIVTEDLKTG